MRKWQKLSHFVIYDRTKKLNLEKVYYDSLKKELNGSILDIGGGGEGIIGRLYQEQVTAIDNRQEELDEAPVDLTRYEWMLLN